MAYIGKAPVNGFHSKQTLSTDGSTTTFTLDFTVADETSLIVSVGGVLQEPKVAYNLSGGGTSIVFTAAPAATDTAYIQYLGQAIVQNILDLSGAPLILDADNDTTITADTDDQIDIAIAGADDFQFTANKFSVLTGSNQSFADNTKGLFGTGDDLEVYHDGTNSYIANKTGALKIATETSGIALTIGHTTSETTVADNLTVTGNLTVGGTTSFGDFDITNVGSIALDTITNDGTDITLDSSADIVIDAAGGNVEFKDAGTLQLTIDMDGTAGAQVIQLGVDSDDLIFKQYDGTTVLTLDDDTTVKVATDLTIGDDASLISDAAVLNFGANSEIKLTHVHDTGLLLTDSGGTPTLQFHDANESISSDGTDLTLAAGADINLTATTDINIPSNVGLTFGNDGEKIEGDGTDLTIAGNNINLTATADVVIPANVGITFGTGEKIEGDSTDLTITSGAKINLTATSDVHLPNNVGIVFGDAAEKIEGDGTDLTIAGNNIKLTAATDVIIPTNVGLHFTDANEKIESDGTDLTINAGADINLTATTDINIPANVGLTFGDDGEKIEGDGTDMTISANNLTIDAAADITLDAAGNDLNFAAGGTTVLTVTNSSSDVIIKPVVDTKDLIFQQRDGTEVMRIEDGAHTAFTNAAVFPEVTLSDGANIAWNVLTSPVAKVTLAGNRNLSAASGGITGQFVSLLVIQDGTGSRTLTPNAVYEFTGDEAPTLTTAANKGDLFVFRYNGSKYLEVGRNLNLTLS